jgi:hypothetical protein
MAAAAVKKIYCIDLGQKFCIIEMSGGNDPGKRWGRKFFQFQNDVNGVIELLAILFGALTVPHRQ